ncbi:hypothetical protein VTO42DRAFT_1206 [Malbranchea cinnamomea]
MSGNTGGISIFTLPRFLCALHNLRLAATGQKREFSTFYCRPSTFFSPYPARSQAPCALPRCHAGQGISIRTQRSQFTTSSSEQIFASSEKRLEDKMKGDSKKKLEPWRIQKEALKKKFKDGWNPKKRLSPDAMEGVRYLHKMDPERFSTPVLAEHFKVSPEAIRRILKSKWRPSEEEAKKRQERWERREARVWNQLAELGLRPQRKEFAPFSDVKVLEESAENEKHDK